LSIGKKTALRINPHAVADKMMWDEGAGQSVV